MKVKSRKAKIGIFLFIVPALAIYILFQIIPIIGAIFFSLVNWNGIAGSEITFVGIKNYVAAFQDPDVILALKNMAKMVIVSVLFHTPVALLMAVAINAKCKCYRLFKALFFVPTVFPLTAVGLMWYFIFMPNGAFNAMLDSAGLGNLVTSWLVNEATAMNTIVFVNVWAGVGYYMVILLAGLTTIPEELYEAASIDGATPVQQFFSITVPKLKPILSMCVMMDIIGSVKVFDLVFAMTQGGPNGLTNLPTTLMYNEAFKYSHYGLGSAIGILIMIICTVATFASNFMSAKIGKND
nr:sugar ABC transporter permease [uncultured Mediterraneibacter sp.]